MSDWRLFMPTNRITFKELVKIVKLMGVKMDFDKMNIPKELHKHFKKTELPEIIKR